MAPHAWLCAQQFRAASIPKCTSCVATSGCACWVTMQLPRRLLADTPLPDYSKLPRANLTTRCWMDQIDNAWNSANKVSASQRDGFGRSIGGPIRYFSTCFYSSVRAAKEGVGRGALGEKRGGSILCVCIVCLGLAFTKNHHEALAYQPTATSQSHARLPAHMQHWDKECIWGNWCARTMPATGSWWTT